LLDVRGNSLAVVLLSHSTEEKTRGGTTGSIKLVGMLINR
jgi:hypothetical protein